MDVALFLTSASLSFYPPASGGISQYQTSAEKFSRAAAIYLSLSLFSLSILEAVPVSWLLLLSHEDNAKDGDGIQHDSTNTPLLTIAHAYWVLLSCMAFFILVVLPSLAGISLARGLATSLQSTFTLDRDNHKYLAFNWKKMCPWWARFVFGLISIILRNLFLLCRTIFVRRRRVDNTVLVMTNNVSNDSLALMVETNTSSEIHNLVSSAETPASSRCSTIVGSFVGVLLVLGTVRSVGPLVVQPSTDKYYSLSVIVSWLCAIGLLISSVLNGFGSVSMPQSCLRGLYLKPVRLEVITKLNAEKESVNEALKTKCQSLRETSFTVSSGGFVQRTFSEMGDEVSNRKMILQTEIEFLEGLYQEMGEDLEELRHSQVMAAAARTRTGKIKSYIGIVFSILLLVRLFNAGMNIWKSYTINVDRHKVAEEDFVTTLLLFLMGHNFVSPQRYSMVSQTISLALTAFLSFSQVRNFLRTVTSVNRRINLLYETFLCNKCTNTKSSTTQNTISLYGGCTGYLAAFTGCCYSLSCIVLIKMMLPEEFCSGFSSALGGMDVFTIHTSVVNSVFATSASISFVVLSMLFGIQRQNNFRHTSNMAFRGADAC